MTLKNSGPTINGVPLPLVSILGDAEATAAALTKMAMSPEAMIEVAIFVKREREKASALDQIEEVMRKRLAEVYAKLPVEKRETRRTDVGMMTYSEGGKKSTLKDRDLLVENLTPEQLRITYKPDLAALRTILKPAEFARYVTEEAMPPRMALKDMPGSETYHEIDF